MVQSGLLSAIELQKQFIDVLYLTNEKQMPQEIKHLLKERNLSYKLLRIDKFGEARDKLGLVGTVIVDAVDSEAAQQQKLARIIETLEMENIGVILITDRVKITVKSFSLAPVIAMVNPNTSQTAVPRTPSKLKGGFKFLSLHEKW